MAVAACGSTISDAECLQDRECSSDNVDWYVDAQVRCQPMIEQQARYGDRWGTGGGDRMWDAITVNAPDYKTLRYRGTNVEFQNGIGAWQRMNYSCFYDPVNKVVDRVVVN